MKRFLTTAAIALSITTAAQADNNTVMFAKGYWRVTHVAHDLNGIPQCLMQSRISFTASTAGLVTIMWAKGKPFIDLANELYSI